MVYGSDGITRSGCPNSFDAFHSLAAGHSLGGGMSFGSPGAAPESTQRTIVRICSSVSDMSFLNFWTPTVRSMCQGGICLVRTRSRMDLAHGRVSSYVTSAIGAIDPFR